MGGGKGVPGGDGAELSLRGQTGVAGLAHREAGSALQAEETACAEVRRGLVCSGKHMQIDKAGAQSVWGENREQGKKEAGDGGP